MSPEPGRAGDVRHGAPFCFEHDTQVVLGKGWRMGKNGARPLILMD